MSEINSKLLMTETHHGWQQILEIKSAIITTEYLKKVNQLVDCIKLQNMIKKLLELISTRKDD